MPFTYFIYHKPTGTKYYGIRYAKNSKPEDLWTKYFTSSKRVKKLIEKYGVDSFEVQVRVVHHSREYLLKVENRVLRKFNVTSNPEWLNASLTNGHNLLKNSYKIDTAQRKVISERNSRVYQLYNPSGELITIKNLKKFAADNNLNYPNMKGLVQGRCQVVGGYKLNKDARNTVQYKVLDSNGDIIVIDDLRRFCQKQGLTESTMRHLIGGTSKGLKSHRGYTRFIDQKSVDYSRNLHE